MKEKQGRDGAGAGAGEELLRVLLPRPLKWKGASGIKEVICCVKRFQRLGLYTRFFLLIALAFIIICICHFYPIQFFPGWVVPDTCISEDCQVRDPLPMSKLSPNLLLVLIHATSSDKETRDAIRDTYASRLANRDGAPIQYRFVLGSHKVLPTVMEKVMREASHHRDIIIFPTITDSVQSLTNRTLLSFKYAYETFRFKYVLKCDDDSFVDILRIASELQRRKSASPLYWGYMRGDSQINHFGRYSEFSWNVCEDYLTYALGGGYVLSREVTKILATNANHLRRYTCEDVSVGAWLSPYNIEVKHDARFNVNTPSRGCKDPYLISHKISAEKMYSYHESVMLEGRMCSWRTYSYGVSGFIYNWTSRTSNCCRKNSFVP